MSNKQIEKLIIPSVESIQQHLVEKNKTDVAKEYKGYISSLGASIIQAGLLSTLSFYSDVSEAEDKKRKLKLMKAIMYVIDKESNDTLLNYTFKAIDPTCNLSDASKPMDFKPNAQKEAIIKDKIMTAAVALKLALRTFKNV